MPIKNIVLTTQAPVANQANKQTAKKEQGITNLLKNIPGIRTTNVFSKDLEKEKGNPLFLVTETGIITNFKGGLFRSRENAIVINGNKNNIGEFYYKGENVNVSKLIKEEPSLLHTTRPLHLITEPLRAQHNAQELANATGRRVKVYTVSSAIFTQSTDKKYNTTDSGLIVNVKLKSTYVTNQEGKKIEPTTKYYPHSVY